MKIKLNKEKNKTLVRLVLLVLVLLTVYAIQTVRNEHSFSYAQEPTQPNSPQTNHEPIQLNSFTFWDHLKSGLIAYTNPHASIEKSLIFVYKFTDQEFENALSGIPESHASLWLIGQAEFIEQAEEKSEDSQLIWTPMLADTVKASPWTKFNSVESETKNNNEKQLYASSVPIPNQFNYDTYWIPQTEFAKRFKEKATILK